jgi:CheY-like chemotaxis protein
MEAARDTLEHRLPPSAPHVVLVDDNTGDIALIRYAFEINDMVVRISVAEDGLHAQELLTHLTSIQDWPCFISLDLNMPRANGFWALEFIRRHHACTTMPVIMLTTSNNPPDRRRAMELGATDFVLKPATFEELVLIVGGWRSYLTM